MAAITNVRDAGVSFRNCRHDFGGPVQFDVVVDGAYPDRKFYVILSQGKREIWLAIPTKSDAERIVSAIGAYEMGKQFDLTQPIEVSECWPGANHSYQITR